MHKQTIQTSTIQYDVVVGKGLLSNIDQYLPKKYNNILIVVDEVVKGIYGDTVIDTLKSAENVAVTSVPAGESSKSIEQYYRLLSEAIEHHLDRKSLIIAFGGGMVGDLAGFVASTYMRGIDFIQVPTTILAHDSSVGGKVAINHPKGKNLIGSFYPPVAVIYDVDTLQSLPAKEIRSGYAEVVKHGLISDQAFFEEVLNVDLTTPLDTEVTVDQLQKGIGVKAKIVEQDERESNIRKFLNFGHTLGHAIESELGYGKITHGEAVAIGMLFALKLSEEKFNTRMPYKALYDWLSKNQYPLSISWPGINQLIDKMKLDKKSENSIVQMVLLEEIGKPSVVNLSDHELRAHLEKFIRELD
ncbi:3-dehydroquinate synthase [Gracilibacillus ureilyticus]|uniref:3-dehydroquinate synthase n=1 Tax=Gracilibacillus ureilyticus TaxID=531814 RepID=A0A1H9LP98_9BACI|nr:3-dehydroquinate synthase [Gracilibacillus ureilyticus]SER13246.1 3-dehydroquinate synthase [Gracilibacillus ureilyticus]